MLVQVVSRGGVSAVVATKRGSMGYFVKTAAVRAVFRGTLAALVTICSVTTARGVVGPPRIGPVRRTLTTTVGCLRAPTQGYGPVLVGL